MNFRVFLLNVLLLFCTAAWSAATLLPPSALLVPTESLKGKYAVSWTASADRGVEYVLEESTDFDGVNGSWAAVDPAPGVKTKVKVAGRDAGETYSYRVKATLAGDESTYVYGNNSCVVPYVVSTKNNAGGTISGGGKNLKIAPGESRTFSVTPGTGFHIASLIVDGVVKIDASNEIAAPYSYDYAYTVHAPADLIQNPKNKHTIAAKFKANSYTVTGRVDGSGGQVAPVGSKIYKVNKKATYTIKPDSGYRIESVQVNGVEQSNLPDSGAYKLTLPAVTEDIEIVATFSAAAPPSSGTTISGVAAAGAPLAGYVSLHDSQGNPNPPLSTLLNKDGSFTFDVSGLVPPFYLKAEGVAGNSSYEMHSVVTATGRANVNPLTEAQVAAATGVDPATLYADPSAKGLSNAAMQTALEQAAADLKTMLKPLLDAWQAPMLNPITDVYVADGKGLDRLFDVADVEVAGGSVAVVDRASQATLAEATISTGGGGLEAITPIDAGQVTSVDTELQQIEKAVVQWLTAIKTISAKFANDSYTQDQALAAAMPYYDTADYGINNGNTLEQEIIGNLEDAEFFSAIQSISNVGIIGEPASGGYLISFLLNLQIGSGAPASLPVKSIAVKKVGSAWKLTGNGFYAEASDIDLVYVQTLRSVFAEQTTTVTGIEFELDDNQQVFASATVTGPGLPAGGITLLPNEWSWELRMPEAQEACVRFEGDGSCMEREWNMYKLSDAVIAAMPQVSTYTLTFNFKDNRPSEVHTASIVKPLPSTQLNEGYFPVIKTPSVTQLTSLAWVQANLVGKTVNLTYSTPTVFQPVHADTWLWYWYSQPGTWGADAESGRSLTLGTNKSASFTSMALPADATLEHGDVGIFTEDTLWRGYETRYNFRQ